MNEKELKEAIGQVAQKYNAEAYFGTEDGYTWVTLAGESINPKIYDEVSQDIANITGRNFYFASARVESIEGAIDADFNKEDENGVLLKFTEHQKNCNIGDYGQKFEPTSN